MLPHLLIFFILFLSSLASYPPNPLKHPHHPQHRFLGQKHQETSQDSLAHPDLQSTESLFEVPFVGEWTNLSPTLPFFNTFQKQSGKIRLSFNTAFQIKTHLIWYDITSDTVPVTSSINFTQYQLIFIDGQYHDDPFYYFELSNITLDKLNNSSQTIQFTTNLTLEQDPVCLTTISINLSSIISPQNFVQQNYILLPNPGPISLHLNSSDCNLNLSATLSKDPRDYTTKTSYDIFFRAIMFINSLLNVKLFTKIFPFSLDSAKISSLTPAIIALWDLVFLINMYIPPDSKLIYLFELSLFEIPPCLLLMIPILHFMKNFLAINTPADILAKKLCIYVLCPVCGLFMFLIFSVIIFFSPTFLFLTSLVLLPQIIANAIIGAPVSFDLLPLGLVIGLRPLFPIYLKGIPENIFYVKSSIFLCLLILMSLGLQVWVLYLQAVRGAKFFVPGRLTRSDYDYFRDGSIESRGSLREINNGVELVKMTKTCKICMDKLMEEPHHEGVVDEKAKAVLDRLGMRPGKIMKTECRHRFHAICLVEWMMVKMECPKCGTVLKPLK